MPTGEARHGPFVQRSVCRVAPVGFVAPPPRVCGALGVRDALPLVEPGGRVPEIADDVTIGGRRSVCVNVVCMRVRRSLKKINEDT